VQAAVRAKACGFDGVEVWAAYHSLLDQFWTPWSNTRDDDWGGSLANRTRFSRLLIERIRRACGEDFVVGLAISYSPAFSGTTLSAESLCEIIDLHDRTGHVDYVTCRLWQLSGFRRYHPALHPCRKADHAADGAAERRW
jgi:2,4-dienoyl-CoA reductase-like NADH-dependent reductase (Old Yellow Enzyme family)